MKKKILFPVLFNIPAVLYFTPRASMGGVLNLLASAYFCPAILIASTVSRNFYIQHQSLVASVLSILIWGFAGYLLGNYLDKRNTSSQSRIDIISRIFWYSGIIWFFGMLGCFPPLGLFIPGTARPIDMCRYIELISIPAIVLMLTGYALKQRFRLSKELAILVSVALAVFLYVLLR